MMNAAVTSFAEWRDTARRFIAAGTEPAGIDWQDGATGQAALFDQSFDQPAPLPVSQTDKALTPRVPKEFPSFARRIACHRQPERWSLLYRALWRLTHGEPHLLRLATDPLVHRLQRMQQEIGRDAHKTKAFVRFRQLQAAGAEYYTAWHRPDHRILPLVAPFFQRRFSTMNWSIFTPDASVAWDGEQLRYGPGTPAGDALQDQAEALWLRYYRATFNPARVKVKMMKREMPVRHWATLPEAALIPGMLAEAAARVGTMIATQEGFASSAAAFLPAAQDYASLKTAAATCQGCPLHCAATQTVFGTGPTDARIMLVGEQPGAQEDQSGVPFVGPAGAVFDEVLHSIGLPRADVYVTNAVKHFKFTRQGKNRIHRAPDAREIAACKPWLSAEIALVQPRVIVTLGVTAAKALVHQGFSLKHDGERVHRLGATPVLTTWHPSAVLRTPAVTAKQAIVAHMQQRLRQAQAIVAA